MIMFKSTLTILVLFLSLSVLAQTEDARTAYQFYREKNYEKARSFIDKAVESPPGNGDAINWHIRGFIYKDLYSSSENKFANNEAREEAITSLKKSMELDKYAALDTMNKKVLRHLATSYYNDAVHIMRGDNQRTISQSIDHYLKYKGIMTFISPDESFQEMDINFYLALSTHYRRIYESDRDNLIEYWDKSLEYLLLVTEIDSMNTVANYNIGVMKYNIGADGIEQMPNDIDIPKMNQIQDLSSKSFEESLPYILAAYEKDPQRIEILKALRGIYISLNNEEMAIYYDNLLKKMEEQQN